MKADQFKILWATAPERLAADRALLAGLGEREDTVDTFENVARAPADLQGQDTAVVLLPPPGLAHDLEDAGKDVQKALLAAGVPAVTASRSDLKKDSEAAWERKKNNLVGRAIVERDLLAAPKEEKETRARLYLGDVLEKFQDIEAADPPIYATGIANLDSVLNGGLREGVYLLQGVPGGGKTALALFMGGSILKGSPKARVLFHSLEMSRQQIAARVLARLAFDLAGELRAGTVYSQECFAKLFAPGELAWQTPSRLRELAEKTQYGRAVQEGALQELGDLLERFMVAYRGAGKEPSVDRLAAIGKAVAGDGPAPVVFVDYLQLLAPPEDYHGERRDVVGYNSSKLEEMAHDLKTPVVVLSSMNRAAVKDAQQGKTLAMNAAKESGDIDYNADAILSLVAAVDGEGDNATPVEFEDEQIPGIGSARKGRVVELQVAKNRTGDVTHKGTHPRLDWLTEWGVYEVSRGIGGALLEGWRKK